MSRQRLLREIKQLGGDATDLDLLGEVLSGSEVEDNIDGSKLKKKSVEIDESTILKDLQSFLKREKIDPLKSKVLEIDESPVEEPIVESNVLDTSDSVSEQSVESLPETKALPESKVVEQSQTVKNRVTIDIQQPWYEIKLEKTPPETCSTKVIEAKREVAKRLWEQDCEIFKKPNKDFITSVLKNGTVTDRVSALTLLIQESPLHSFYYLNEQLINGMAKKKARREALLAIESIKDLMLNTILPDRKLVYFVDQPIASSKVTNKHLILWYFEDALKNAYFEFVKVLEALSKDSLEHVKSKAVNCVFELLTAKPEQENNLLAILVNKIGDLDRKIASKSTYLLSKLLLNHPAMKMIVITEVERVLFRPNMSDRACYYAITFLNQIVLSNSKDDVSVANHLIHLYFKLFEAMVIKLQEKNEDAANREKPVKDRKRKKGNAKNKKENDTGNRITQLDSVNSKMMASLLTGVNRAFPYCRLDNNIFKSHLDTLYTITHIAHFNTSIQALTLIYQVQTSRENTISDRFYRALYETLFDGRLFHSSKQALYLNLLFKALKSDTSSPRIRSFVKRILQCILQAQVPLVCGSLFLLSELFSIKTYLWSMIKKSKAENENPENKEDAAYDPRKREPMYANADKTCFWELSLLAQHFHPTVSLYAKLLLSGDSIKLPENATNYDPLQNHTLSRFLDRFVYKAPKKAKSEFHGDSLMQPRTNGKTKDRLLLGGRKRNVLVEDETNLNDTPVNLKDWKTQDKSSIPPDEKNVEDVKEETKLDSDQDISETEAWDAMTKSSGFDKRAMDEIEFSDDEMMDNMSNDPESEEEIIDEETLAKMDGFGQADDQDEDSDDEMERWANGSNNQTMDDDSDQMFDDELSSDMEEKEDETQDKNPKKSKSKKIASRLLKMEKLAKAHGYKGDMRSKNLDAQFASAEDFEDLLDLGEEEPVKKKIKR